MSNTSRTLNSESIYHAFINGALQIIKNRNDLNSINVFPVQDGDTGNNLSSMMKTIIDEAEHKATVKSTMESLSDAALKGARGNSGIIFAQYLNGMSVEMADAAAISMNDYALVSTKAVKYAYNSIENPVEGTMITVMREWGDALSEEEIDGNNVIPTMQKAKERLNQALANTQFQLKELKQAKVVDAGAKGFTLFIHGILEYFRTGTVEKHVFDVEDADLGLVDFAENHEYQDLTFRYCTECMIESENLDESLIKESLKPFGDSLIVASGKRRARIHIHTNTPESVFDRLYQFGKILYPKADDMVKQQDIVTNRKYDIALVTDSIADLPQDYIMEEQIHIIHLSLLYKENTFIDKLTVTPEQILAYSREGHELPTSSLPDQKNIDNLFNYLKSYYDKVLVLPVSKELSGTYNALSRVAEKMDNESFKIKVINTRQNSGAQGLLVHKAAELIKAGRDLDDIVSTIEGDIANSKILVRVMNLDNMIRSGRLSTRAGKIGKKVGLKPIVTLDEEGKGGLFTVAFSIKGSLKKLTKHMIDLSKKKEIESYNIVHINNPDEAEQFAERFTEIIGKEPEYITETSSIVAVGAGEGAVAISYIVKDRK